MDYQKLAKILALAGSDNTGEATTALRMAAQMLARAGLDFADLVHRVEPPREEPSSTGDAADPPSATDVAALQTELATLRLLTQNLIDEMNAMRLQSARQTAQLDKARKNIEFLRDRLRRAEATKREVQRQLNRDELERQMLLRQLQAVADALRALGPAVVPGKSAEPDE